MYDNPQPTPDFHREAWDLYSSDHPMCAIAAPRGHAKSSALTHDYVLAVLLFRVQDYIVVVSATEDLTIGHLGDIARELRDNEEIVRHFHIKSLSVDAKTEIVVDFHDGHQAKIVAKGAGQKMRGMKWKGKRPGLIVMDDGEEDEAVFSKDRRRAFGNWFRRALIPCLRQGGLIRVHGTIMHDDSLLNNLMKSKGVWKVKKYKAHRGFDDFDDILWPEQFPEETLRRIRQNYIESNDAAGYSQEYLNDPFDNSDAFFRRGDFIPMDEDDYDVEKKIKVGCDFAVSKADRANSTSFTVGGQDTRGIIYIIDQYKGRWDPTEWIDILFEIQSRHNPDEFLVEGGTIWRAIEKTIYSEMRSRDLYMNMRVITPIKDKSARGRPFQKRHRAGGMRFDSKADWFSGYQDEILRFTGTGDSYVDDQYDSTAILVKGFEDAAEVEEEDFKTDDEWEMERDDPRQVIGRNVVTGY